MIEPGAAGDGGAGCVVVSLIGEFDMSNTHRLREQLSTMLDGSLAVVVLDLGALDFADSTVLGRWSWLAAGRMPWVRRCGSPRHRRSFTGC